MNSATARYQGPVNEIYDWFRFDVAARVLAEGNRVDAHDPSRRIAYLLGTGKQLKVITVACEGDELTTTVTVTWQAPNAGRFARGNLEAYALGQAMAMSSALADRWPPA